MIADNLHDFLIASVGASASFIGLLFVALTLVIGRLPAGSPLVGRQRVLAESSYTALITVFFVSMVGLIPGASMGWAMVAIGWLGILASLRLSRASRASLGERESSRVVGLLTLIYAAQIGFGIYTANHSTENVNAGLFFGLLFVLYTTALGRAWALIGFGELDDEHSSRRTRSHSADSS